MPTLTPGTPITVAEPRLLVENKFRPGRYRFRLVVFDESGLESAPDEIIVSVQERRTDPPGPVVRVPIDVRVLTDPPIIRRPP